MLLKCVPEFYNNMSPFSEISISATQEGGKSKSDPSSSFWEKQKQTMSQLTNTDDFKIIHANGRNILMLRRLKTVYSTDYDGCSWSLYYAIMVSETAQSLVNTLLSFSWPLGYSSNSTTC